MTDPIQEQSQQIFDSLVSIPFTQCQSIERSFANIPPRPGLYAIRHRTEGLLYIGKTKSLRGRFSGGHKAFLWAWLDRYNDHRCPYCYPSTLTLGNPYNISRTRSHDPQSN